MRKAELSDLLGHIYSSGPLSRVDLAQRTNVAPSHVGVVVREAINQGLLVEGGFVPSTGGRRKVLVHVNPDAAQLLGIDIGRTHTTFVVTDFGGKVLAHDWLPTVPARGKEALLQFLFREVDGRLAAFGNIAAIGIAHSGVVEPRAGKVLFWPMVDGWNDTPLRQIFADKYNLAVSVDDRVRAMAIAEQRSGHLTGLRDFILVYVGTGIMSSIFVEGVLYGGRDGMAGEIGHSTVVENGEPCSCGNRGCLERYSSADAIVGGVRAELERGAASILHERARNNLDRLSIEDIVAAAQAQDRVAERFLAEAGMHLGTTLASVINLLNPERIILTGKVAQTSGDLLLRPLMYEIRQRALPRAVHNLSVVISKLGDEAAAVGISHVAGAQVFKRLCDGMGIGQPMPVRSSRLATVN